MIDPLAEIESILGMPPKPVDHKAEAMLALHMAARDVSANFETLTGERKADIIALGQLHATLYLAEQQRIANLIAWSTHDGYHPSPAVQAQIEKGLGL